MIKVEEKKNKFKGKKVLVVGLARSGTGAANLLVELGAKVSITDKKSPGSLEDQINKLLPAVKFIEDSKAGDIIDSLDLIVISPGVPLYVPFLVKASIKGVPIIGELELAYQVVKSAVSCQQSCRGEALPRPFKPTPAFIGITGTNGKSTTTTLIDLILKDAGYKTLLGGNIGNALTEEILRGVSGQLSAVGRGEAAPRPYNYIVAEISSFQLETIEEFRPNVAAILNITPDHLDRYNGMGEYIDAKARIFEKQTPDDFLIINADDPEIMKVKSEKLKLKSERPKIIYFSRMKEVEGAYFKDGLIHFNLPDFNISPSTFNLQPSTFKIKGVHNIENAMAASLVALISGCSTESVRNVLSSFPGLEHRIEFVAEVDGVRFINDSKGTNVGAVAKSLEDFNNIILIMGGLDKGNDFSILRDLIEKKVKVLILIGKAKEVIEKALGAVTETHKVSDLGEAVAFSMSKASAGDVVMLSPGCASFDMFKDFEDRGKKFKEAVHAFKNKNV